MDVLDESAILETSGLVGLGYVARVDRAGIAEHEAWVRSRGVPDYTAATAGEHEQLYLVSFIEPLELNREALGVDIADGTNRRAAAETAMRQARLAMSRRIRVIVGETVTPGFLLFYPVYERGAPIETELERERALEGWVYAAVRVDRLVAPLQSRMADEIVFNVYEGKTIAGSRLLWSASSETSGTTAPRFERTTQVNVFGQPWILVTQSQPGLRDASSHTVAWLALLSGLALGSMAVLVNLRLTDRHERAERKAEQAEADLEVANEQTRRLSIVARNIHNAVVITNRAGEIEWANEGFTRLTGWPAEEVVGRRPGSFLQGPDTDPATVLKMREAQRGGTGFAVDVLNYRRDGTPYWVFSEAQPLFGKDGSRTGYMAIQSDITERKQTAIRIAEQEARLRFVFESSPVGMSWMRDQLTETRVVNPAFRRITGIEANEVRNVAALNAALHPEDRARVSELDALLDGGSIDRFEIERRFVHPDGRVIWAEYSRRCYVDDTSGHRQDVTTLVDITALKSRTADLEAAKELAEEANKGKSQFLAMMSHEIRTPMNGVIGMASILLESGLTEEQEEFTRTIVSCGSDLLTIINDILDFSKVESGHLEMEKERLDLMVCVENAIDVLAMRAAEKKLEFLVELSPMLPRVIEGDSTRLRQILVNLIGNAVKFTDAGEVRLKVDRRAIPGSEDEIRFEVFDTGIGVAKERIPRLFEAFTQDDASSTRRFGGTGLGLPICKRLVGLMGGEMWWDSEPGRGTMFGFSLRARVLEDAEAASAPGDADLLTTLGGRRLLILDDNASSRRITAEMAQHWQMSVVGCATVADGIEQLVTATPFDLVLVDHDMGEQSGREGLRRLREAVGSRLPPVMLMAPLVERLQAEHGQWSSGILKKPLLPLATARAWSKCISRGAGIPGARETLPAVAPLPGRTFDDLRVLVVEDNPVNQELISRMLRAVGYTYEIVNDGVEALERFAQAEIDVILMDVQLPNMDGYEATRRVRASKGRKRRPWIIAVTANAMAGDRERCLRAGMDDYLSKPLKTADVAGAMQRARAGLGAVEADRS